SRIAEQRALRRHRGRAARDHLDPRRRGQPGTARLHRPPGPGWRTARHPGKPAAERIAQRTRPLNKVAAGVSGTSLHIAPGSPVSWNVPPPAVRIKELNFPNGQWFFFSLVDAPPPRGRDRRSAL